MANKLLAALDPLIGDWDVVLSKARFFEDPDDTIRGEAKVSRELDDAVVLMRVAYADDRMPIGKWVIGVDDDREGYSVLYNDDRGVSRICQMSFDDGVLDIWRHATGFTQKFNARLDRAGKVLSGEWQFCEDGMNWHRDFRVDYSRR